VLGRSGGHHRARTRAGLGALAAAVGLLAGPAQAFADSATISVTTTTGASDPAARVARVFTLSGTSALPASVWVKHRAAGGAPCAPSAYTDSGDELFEYGANSFYGTSVNGAFSLSRAETWSSAGAEVFCIWLSSQGTSVTTPFTQAITFRAATGTITATVNPITPRVDEPAAITVTGASEAPAEVFAKVRPAGGAGCAPTYLADSGTELLYGNSVDGAFSLSATTKQSTAGSYLLCLWLATSTDDPAPIAGPQPQRFDVVGPAPPPVAPTRVPVTPSLQRRGSRYSGRLATAGACLASRTVLLRRAGSGTRSFGRTLTRSNGTFTFQRKRRLRGRVYAVVLASRKAQTICSAGRSATTRG
jgi:hypothetical protein